MKKLILVLAMIFSFAVAPLAAHATTAQTWQDICASAPDSPTCQQAKQQATAQGNPNPIAGPTGVLQTVTNVMAFLTGLLAVIMIIVSGITYITAGGAPGGQRSGDNPTKAKKARAQLIAACVGLIIVTLSWSILSFIIQKVIK